MELVPDDLTAYNALTKGVAFQRVSDAELVVATGSDVVPLLQGLFLNNLFTLAEPGSGQLNAAVNNVGRLLSLFRVIHIDDLLLLDLPPGNVASGFLRHLRIHVINEDAKFNDKSSGIEAFTIAGPNSLVLLKKLVRPEIRFESLPPFHARSVEIPLPTESSIDAIVIRLDDLNDIDTFKLILTTTDAPALQELLLAEGIPTYNDKVFDFVRLEHGGRARWGVELSNEIIPLEADLNPIVSYNKGCYLGQEIIARLDSRKRFAKRLCTIKWPRLDGVTTPSPDAPLFFRDPKKKKRVEVGRIIYAIDSQAKQAVLGRAYLKRPAHEMNAEIYLTPDPNDTAPAGRVVTVAEESA